MRRPEHWEFIMRRLLSIALMLLALLPAYARADVVVIVRREAKAAGNYVRVCDVARVEGPREQAGEISSAIIGPTPYAGESMEISRWDIESRLYELGIAHKIIFSGNDVVRVLGMGTQYRYPGEGEAFSLAQLADAHIPSAAPAVQAVGRQSSAAADRARDRTLRATGYLGNLAPESLELINRAVSEYLGKQYSRSDIEIENFPRRLSAPLPARFTEVQVEWGKGSVPGSAQLQLRVREDGDAQVKTVMLDTEVDVYALAPVAARPLSKGESLEAKDVTLQRIRMEPGQGYFTPDPKSVAGRELKRSLKKGEPVLPSETSMPNAVKQGDEVINRTASNGWQLTAVGKALGSGNIGEIIQVQDPTTKAKYDARIIGPGMVEVVLKKKPFADFGTPDAVKATR